MECIRAVFFVLLSQYGNRLRLFPFYMGNTLKPFYSLQYYEQFGDFMSFVSWRSYYKFSYSVKSKTRYIFDKESKTFLKAIKNTCQDREMVIPKDSVLWRAQKGHSWRPFEQDGIYIDDIPCPYPQNRMKPLPDSASGGRANPRGIPCLYMANNKETAMSEVRPWLGSIVSLGMFKTNSDFKIINFSSQKDTSTKLYLKEPPLQERVRCVWSDMDNAFSKPIEGNELKSEYAPTQIISEYIKSLNYDGIAYKSSLSDGYNFALFSLDAAELVKCSLHRVKSLNYSFEEETPY